MLSTQKLLLFCIVFLMPIPPGFGQAGRPVIIRDTDIAEGIEDREEAKPKERDPVEAKKNIDIGDFYNKRKNYVGAIQRYLTAIEYQPDSSKAYKSLVKAYQSIVKAYESIDLTKESLERAERECGEIHVARKAFIDFLRINPDSDRYEEFQGIIVKLEEVSSRFDNLR